VTTAAGHQAGTQGSFTSKKLVNYAAEVPENTTAITHLRDVLDEATYESHARRETMTTADIVAYAYDQIDQARTELEHPS
jgi:hypothetical protein